MQEETLHKTVKDAASVKVADKVADKIEADPILMNKLNQEPWWQSGIMWFGTGGVVWAIGTLFTQIGQHGLAYDKYNAGLVVTAVGSLISTSGVLWRRFWPGLRPLFHRDP